MGLTMTERGQYITLLCLQHQKGHLTEKDIELAVGSASADVMAKFISDDEGKYFNKRMEEEAEIRRRFTESRRKSSLSRFKETSYETSHDTSYDASHDEHTIHRMDNDNKNINTNTIKDIIEYLNEVLGTKYKYSADYIKKHINARLSEGYTLEDFKTVIDKKYAEWIGTEFAKFLRPETLFGTKFVQYLNQVEKKEDENDGAKKPYRSSELYGEYVG
jgi:uncharacterized phage protein (TIGR02220 family)